MSYLGFGWLSAEQELPKEKQMKNLKDRIGAMPGIPEFAMRKDSAFSIIPEAWVLRENVLKAIDEEDPKRAPSDGAKITVTINLLCDPSRINISIPTDTPMEDFTEELRKALLECGSAGYRE